MKIEITLSDENLREMTRMEKQRVLHPTDPQNDQDCIHIKAVDAAIQQGLIERYVPTTKDRLIPVLDALNRLELDLKRNLLNPFEIDQPIYRDVVERATMSPSVLAELNDAVSDHGINFTETPYRIQIHRGHLLIDVDALREEELRDVLTAAEKLLETHKEKS